jgi:hypothetical protein
VVFVRGLTVFYCAREIDTVLRFWPGASLRGYLENEEMLRFFGKKNVILQPFISTARWFYNTVVVRLAFELSDLNLAPWLSPKDCIFRCIQCVVSVSHVIHGQAVRSSRDAKCALSIVWEQAGVPAYWVIDGKVQEAFSLLTVARDNAKCMGVPELYCNTFVDAFLEDLASGEAHLGGLKRLRDFGSVTIFGLEPFQEVNHQILMNV